MLIHQTGGRKLDLVKPTAKDLLEALLVVVEAVIGRVILATYIDDDVQRLQQLWIARADDISTGEFLPCNMRYTSRVI